MSQDLHYDTLLAKTKQFTLSKSIHIVCNYNHNWLIAVSSKTHSRFKRCELFHQEHHEISYLKI